MKTLRRSLVVLIIIFSNNIFAEIPTTFFITDNNTSVKNEEFIQQELGQIFLNPENKSKLSHEVIQTLPINAEIFRKHYYQKYPKASYTDAGHFLDQLKTLLTNKINELSLKYGGKVTLQNGVQQFDISDGIGFWNDMVTYGNTDQQIAGMILAESLSQTNKMNDDVALNIVGGLLNHKNNSSATVVNTKISSLSTSDIDTIKTLSKRFNIDSFTEGPYLVLGKGEQFRLTRDLIIDAQTNNNSAQQKDFDRILRYMSQKNINLQPGNAQNAAAYYRPDFRSITLVVPGYANLNSFTHEATHARFDRFDKTTAKWAQQKNYAIPYELDGNKQTHTLSKFGGYMNMLNEVNSYRLGSSFDGPMSDEEIVKHLTKLYANQAGEEATKEFAGLWNKESLNGKSIPKIILDKFKSINAMSNDEVEVFGSNAIQNNDLPGMINYLRLLATRNPQNNYTEEQLKKINTIFEKGQAVDEVVNIFKNTTNPDPQSQYFKNILANINHAFDWLSNNAFTRMTQSQIQYMPQELLSEPLFLYNLLNSSGFSSIDVLINKSLVNNTADNQKRLHDLYNKINAAKGLTYKDKLNNYVIMWNKKDFNTAFENFIKSPNDDDRYILSINRYKITPSHIQKLLTSFFDTTKSHAERLNILALFESVLPKDLISTADQLIAKNLFNGEFDILKIDFVNLLQLKMPPNSLPQLKSELFKNMNTTNKDDAFICRQFLLPNSHSEQIQPKDSHPWGDLLLQQIYTNVDNTPNGQLVAATEHIRLSLGFAMPANRTLLSQNPDFDAKLKELATADLAKISSQKSLILNQTSDFLWKLLGHQDAEVMKSARHTILAHPSLLVSMEKKIILELQQEKAGPQRTALIKLLADIKPGFFPVVDALMPYITPQNKAELKYLSMRYDYKQNCLFNIMHSL